MKRIKFQNHSVPQIGLHISLFVSLLINSYQIMVLLFNAPPPPGELGRALYPMQTQVWDFVINFTFFTVIAFLVYMLNMYILKKYRGWGNFIVRLVLSLAFSMSAASLMIFAYSRLGSLPENVIWGMDAHYHSRSGMVTFIMIGISQIIYLNKRNQQQRIEVERLSAENNRSQYIALKNQLDPHFLFNSLNTLSGLIGSDTEKAQQYVQQLSDIFRYSMQDKELVTIAQEVEFAQTFGELMKIRYGDALTIEYRVAHEVMEKGIMPFSLQILIENAVKHNVISPKRPLTISIYSDAEQKHIVVENPIQAKREPQIGEGIGLANLTKRYELIGHCPIAILQHDAVFSVSLPIIAEV